MCAFWGTNQNKTQTKKNACKYPLVTISTEVRFTFIVQQSIKIIIKQVRYNKVFLAPENKIDFFEHKIML